MKSIAALLALALGLYGLWGLDSIAPGSLIGYFAGVLALEAKAVPLPGLGWISLAPAFVLAAALTPAVGAGGAILLMLAGWGVRCLVSRRVNNVTGLLMEAVPTLAAVALIKLLYETSASPSLLMVGLAATALWGVLITFLPAQLACELQGQERWVVARGATWLVHVSLGLWAIATANLAAGEPGLELLMLGPLLVLQGLVRRAVENPSASDYRQARSRLTEALTRGKVLSATLQETEQLAEASSAGLELVKAFTERMGQNDSLQGLWNALNAEVRSQVTLRSTALYLPKGGRPEIIYFDSPDRDRAQSALRMGLAEPAVARCWSDGRSLYTKKPPPGERVFQADGACAAVGFGPGVLYLGKHTSEPFTPAQKAQIELLAGHAGNLVAAMLRREVEREALSSSQEALGELTEWSGRLSALLNGARMLAGTLDPGQLMRELEDVMNGLFGTHAGCFFRLTGKGLEYYHGWPSGSILHEPASVLAQHIHQNHRSLSFEDVAQCPFPPFHEGQRSFLGVPVESQHGAAGVLLMGSTGSQQADDQEFLYLVGLMLAVAYRGADIHWQLKSSQEQLVQAGKLAAVGQLAAGVAHELNTPLGTVLLSLEGAERALSKRPERVPERLERARRAVEHAQRITSNLLVFSRNEAGDYQPLDFSDLVLSTVESLRGTPTFAGVRIETNIVPTGLVRGSAVELGQLILQLANNAAEATAEQAERILRVSTKLAENQVYLAVGDNGTGIDSEVAARMFEPFFSTKPVGHGTGLGLSTCREIAHRHAGTLEFKRQPKGALFLLRLPSEAPP
jgi:signal transduction histidine kinase